MMLLFQVENILNYVQSLKLKYMILETDDVIALLDIIVVGRILHIAHPVFGSSVWFLVLHRRRRKNNVDCYIFI